MLNKDEIYRNIDQEYIKYILSKLVQIKSVNPPVDKGEEIAAKFLVNEMKKLGLEVSLDKVDYGRANSVGIMKGSSEKPVIALNGHIDVVPADEKLWNTDPFKAVFKDGKIYGRGTSDMKGAIASMLGAAKLIRENNLKFKGTLMLSFVCDEENSNKGIYNFLKKYSNIDYAIIGEATNLKIDIGHRGIMSIKIKTFGTNGHASEPDKFINAIYNMNKVIEEIINYSKKLKNIHHDVLPSPTIVITKIKGGEKFNIIPSSCEIILDRRWIPGETKEQIIEDLRNILENIKNNCDDFSYEIEKKEKPFCNPALLEKNNKFLTKTNELYSYYFDKRTVSFNYFRASCEQVFFLNKGIDTIIFGPGDVSQAHSINEFIELKELYDAAGFYTLCILNNS